MISMDRVTEAMNRLAASNLVGYDAETSGLDWKRCHTVGHVLTFGPAPQDSYYLPFRHAGGGNIEGVSVPDTTTGWDGTIHPIEAEIIARLSAQDITVFYHNGAFDMKFKHRLGFKARGKFDDTMLNAALLNEYQKSFSLDFCCGVAGVQAKLAQPMYDHLANLFGGAATKSQMANFWRTAGDDPVVVEYAEGDGTSTWQLREWQIPQIEHEGLFTVASVERRVMPVLHRMSVKGIRVDLNRLDQVTEQLKGMLKKAESSLPSGFNVRSSTQIRALMEENEHTDWPKTALGNPSFDEKWLKTTEVGRSIVVVRKYSHMLNTFIGPLYERHIHGGRVHCDFNQLRSDEYGTITGRLSSSNPNMQQIPKRNKELGPMFRSVFIPDYGKIWGAVDYSQCEPRLLAYYARCKVLMRGYLSTPHIDAHSAVANAAAIDRESGKRLNQALLTGAGIAKIKSMLEKPDAEAQAIVNAYFGSMPEIRTIQKRAAGRMKQRGYVLSLLGRKARLEPGKDYTALNRLLQCGNADIIKVKMAEIGEYLESEGDSHGVDMLNNVHDAIDYQFPEESRPIYRNCLDIMSNFGAEDAIPLDIPMGIEIQEGPSWGYATYEAEDEYMQGRFVQGAEADLVAAE